MHTGVFSIALLFLAMAGVFFGQNAGAPGTDAAHPDPKGAPPSLEDLPVVGLAGITFKVADLDKARSYYQGILGFAEAFDLKGHEGRVTSVWFKVNDDQFIEVIPTLKSGEVNREERVIFESNDLKRLHSLYESRGLNPGRIQKGPDGNLVFRVIGPEGNNLDFLQYGKGSEQEKIRGKFLSSERISTYLWHVGIMTRNIDTSGPFYREKLGFTNLHFGIRGNYVEIPRADLNTETKPPLSDTPETHVQYESEQWGAINHISLRVSDMRAVRDLLQKRGGFSDLRVRAHVGNNRHWLMFIFDPAGTRTEIMGADFEQDLQPMTVMAPGTSTGVITPKTPGVLPWP